MQKLLFLIFISVISLYACGGAVVKKSKNDNTSNTVIGEFLSPTKIDIGSLPLNKTFIYPIQIYNYDSSDLLETLTYALTDSDNFTIIKTEEDSCKTSIPIGKGCKIYLEFKPKKTGNFNAVLSVSSAAEEIISIDIVAKALTANSPSAIRALSMDSFIDIGDVRKASQKSYPLLIQNIGDSVAGDNVSSLTYEVSGGGAFIRNSKYTTCSASLVGMPNKRECLYSIDIDTSKRVGEYSGQLTVNINGIEQASTIVKVTLTDDKPLVNPNAPVKIAMSDDHGLFTTSTGEVYSWGLGNAGQLGDNRSEFYPVGSTNVNAARNPRKVLFPPNIKIKSIAAGVENSYALTNDGKLYVWGHSRNSTLIDSALTGIILIPTLVSTPEFEKIYASNHHVIAIDFNGKAYGWGANGDAQTGTNPAISPVISPTPIQPGEITNGVKITQAATGINYTLFLGDDGGIYAVGSDAKYKLGIGTPDNKTYDEPTKVKAPANIKFTYIAAGAITSAAIGEDGKIYTWGSNEKGGLGNGKFNTTVPYNETPNQLDTPNGVKFKSVALGTESGYALTTDGKVYSWGNKALDSANPTCAEDQFMDFSSGETKIFIRNKPYLIGGLPENVKIESVVASRSVVILSTKEGRMFGCGKDNFYQRFRYPTSKDLPVEQPYMP